MAKVTPIRSSWQMMAAASDRVTQLIEEIPGLDYQFSPETREDLCQAAVLLRRAIPLLDRAVERDKLRECSTD